MTATARSVIDVDVNSESFKKFKAAFDQYKAALAETPGEWGKVGAAAAKAHREGEKAAQEQAEAVYAMTSALASAVRQQGELNRGAGNSNRTLKDVARTTKSIAADLASGTFHLLKWAALGGVVGAATGGFGIGALAAAGADARSTSLGLGITSGQLRAGQTVYGPMGVNAQGIMGNILTGEADAQSAQRRALIALGFRGADLNRNPGEMLPDVIQRAVEKFQSKPLPQRSAWMRAMGLDSLMDFNTLYGLSNLQPGELAKTGEQFRTESKRLNTPDPMLEKMKELSQTFGDAKTQIENAFIKGLVPFVPQLKELSTEISGAIGRVAGFLTDPETEKGARYLNRLLTDPDFAIDEASKGADRMANDVKNYGINLWRRYTPYLQNPLSSALGQAMGDADDTRREWDKINMSDADFQAKYGMPKWGDRNRGKGVLTSRGGIDDESIAARAGSDVATLRARAKAAGLPADYWRQSDYDYRRSAGPGTAASPTVKIDVSNQTGGDTNVIASQLAH